MYEDQTFEVIQKRILSDVDDGYHKDEGSLIYTATAATAAEHMRIYIALDKVLSEMFPDTATREYLIHHAALRGLEPKEATQALWYAQASPEDTTVPIGSRFNCGDINLQVVQNKGSGVYLLKVETAGTTGNAITGKLTAISYIKGLSSMTLTTLYESGTDAETTEEFRKRFLTFLQKPATSGNKNSYYNWAMDVDGVGDVKIFAPPDKVDGVTVPDGNVYIYAINENTEPAGEELIAKMETYIETERPIGAKVTIKPAEVLDVNVSVTVTIATGATIASITKAFKAAINEYLQENALNLKRVSPAKLGDLLLDVGGVEDYADILVNGSASALAVGDIQIATVGSVEVAAE